MADSKEMNNLNGSTVQTSTSTTTASTTPAVSGRNDSHNATDNAVTSTSSVPTEPPQVTRQKYEEAKRELQALLTRKKQVDTNLVNLENAIYLFEGSYLEDTQQNGNIIRGFDGYLSNRMDRRKPKFTELDRLFSLSSSTYQKALAQKEEKEQDSSQEDSSSVSARKEKKRKLKGQDSTSLKKKKASAGKDTEDELDV